MGKLKKILRKVGKGVRKAAPIALLALSAAALAKRRKAKALNAITAGDIADTGTLSGKAGFEGDVPSAPKVDIVPKKKPVLFAPNKTANPNAIPHEEIFNARHGIGITKDPGWVDAKTGSRDDLMKFMTQKDNQNYAIRQKALKRARGPDYSVSGLKQGGRITLKSGGRVGVGKAKRGFGRALRKK